MNTLTQQRDVQTITAMLNLIESPAIRKKVETALRDEQVQTDRVLTSDEAGRILGVSGRTVFQFAKGGMLRRVKYPGRKIGGGFLESDVRDLLARSVEGGPER